MRPADPADATQAFAFALWYRGDKRIDTAGEVMARVTAERIAEHLRLSGFVVMQRPPTPLPSSGHKG